MPRVVVIFNRKSGRNRRDPDEASSKLRAQLSSADRFIDARTLADLARAADDVARDSPRAVAISGGDGTLGVTLTALVRAHGTSPLPPVVLLRSGTMNTVANAIGAPRRRAAATLTALVAALRRGESPPVLSRSLLRANDDYGFLFGAGVVYGFLEAYYSGGAPSPRVAAATLLRGMGSALLGGEMVRRMAEPFDGLVRVDGEPLAGPSRYLAVAAGTVDQIGLGFRPFHRMTARHDELQLLAIHTSPLGLVSQLPRVRMGVAMGRRHVTEAMTSRATLEARSGTVRYMLDGDLRSVDGPVTLGVGPEVRFLIV